MKRFVEGEDRRQGVMLPEFLDDYVSEENPVRVIDAFVEALDMGALGFEGVVPEATGRPGYHPGLLLRLYVYGYLNQVASSRRLEREAQRNVEVMWLTGRLGPDFKTIADFRRDNGPAIRATCRRFVDLCRKLELFTHALAAIDGSKFKAVNARDRNPFGTLRAWMGSTHFKTRNLDKVRTEMSLHVLAYNLKRVIAIIGPKPLMAAMKE